MTRWLLHGPAQITRGTHAGGVAGTLDENGRATYVYAEITGYFLQWLAWRARFDGTTPELCARADAATRWLARWAADPHPPTRAYLQDPPDDWRNHASFTFDLAMALRGCAAAIDAGLVTDGAAVMSALCAALSDQISPAGDLVACTSVDPEQVPSRWSTQRGAFLAKAAAGILRAADQVRPIPADLVVAADATFRASIQALAVSPHPELHPLCYAFEGVLALPEHEAYGHALAVVHEQYQAVLADFARTGALHELRNDTSSPQRIDVLAQCIRVGDLLVQAGATVPGEAHEALVDRLVAAIRANGSVAFACHDGPQGANVWAAMFASQALHGVVVPGARDAPLIV